MKTTAIQVLLLCAIVTMVEAQDMQLSEVLLDGADWELVGEGYRFTEAPAADRDGNVFFADVPASQIFKVGLEGDVTIFASDTHRTSGLMFGPDGVLYGCQSEVQKIVAYDAAGKARTVAEDVPGNDLVVSSRGDIYVTDPRGKKVWLVRPDGEKRVVAEGIEPNGIILWPGEGTLVVTEKTALHLWTYRVESDGSLAFREAFYQPLAIPSGKDLPGSDGMAVDSDGRLYLASHAGLQSFDTQGRPSGVIRKPQEKFLSNVVFGGKGFDVLFVTCKDRVYRRQVKVSGPPYFLKAK